MGRPCSYRTGQEPEELSTCNRVRASFLEAILATPVGGWLDIETDVSEIKGTVSQD